MSNAVLVLLGAWFAREEFRPFSVKVDEVLRIFSPFKLVLEAGMSELP